MNEEVKSSNSHGKSHDDPRTKMLEALAKKQKGHKTGKNSEPKKGSKVGAGQTGGVAPKIHRRKSGSP